MGQASGAICTSPPAVSTLAEVSVTTESCHSVRSPPSSPSRSPSSPSIMPVQIFQAEGHPAVRVFEGPEGGSKVIDQIPSNTLGYLYEIRGCFCMVSDGHVKGWVGAKNVRKLPANPTEGGYTRPLSPVKVVSGTSLMGHSSSEGSASAPIAAMSGDASTRYPSTASGAIPSPPAPHIVSRSRFLGACPKGTKCKHRDQKHLSEHAHPFDPDYPNLCKVSAQQPEDPSIVGLFQWIDVDGSGKVSRKELEEAMPLLSTLFEEKVTLSDKSWHSIDEDGNGAVNLSEFSCWAGPRLGLPLGVGHLFAGHATDEAHGCAILGCPCEGFVPKEHHADKLARKHDEKIEFKRRLTKDLDGVQRSTSKISLPKPGGHDSLQICKCGHKFAAHRAVEAAGEVPCPMYWDQRCIEKGDFNELVEMTDEHTIELFQDLVDRTYSPVYTRDRKKHHPDNPRVPKGFTVLRCYRSENSRIWREYGVRRAQMLNDAADAKYRQFDDVVSTAAWLSHGGALADRLKTGINEWYLFHGSTLEAAEKICKNDFRLQYSGKSTGSLYGRGIYLSESVTKSDEYARANAAGEYAMILCRVVGGHAKYTEELEPDPEDLVKSCIEGPYDCIIGDRRRTRGTYREFVIYDSENVYAEYIIHYKRNY